MASFPTSVKSFSARTSGETIAASHINDLQDEVAAIEADLLSATPTYITKATTGVNASALSTGTLPIARLDANVLLTTSTTGMNASALSTGTVPDARLSGTYTLITANNATFAFGKSEGALNVNSATTATTANNSTYAFGKSEGALNVNSAATATQTTNATNLNSQPGSYYTNASNLATGTLAIARLDANVILTTSTTGMNASAVSTGTLPDARLSSNVALLNAANVFTATQAVGIAYTDLFSASTAAALQVGTTTAGGKSVLQAYVNDGTDNNRIGMFVNDTSGKLGFDTGSSTGIYSGLSFLIEGTEYMTLSRSGLLTVSGFGTHSFSAGGNAFNGIRASNSNNGAGASSGFELGNDQDTSDRAFIYLYSSGVAASGAQQPDGLDFRSGGTGGMSLGAANASGDVRIYSRNALAATFGASQAATFLGDITVSKGGYDSFFKTDATGLKIGHNSSIRNIEFQINSTTVAKIDTNGDFYTNDGTVSSLSDQRLKTEVRGFSAGLAEVLALSPKVYVYRDDVPGFQRATDKEFVSDIAQRLQTLIPEAVKQNGDWLAVAQEGPIVWALVNAIQELAAEVDALRASAGLAKKVRTMNPVVGDDRAVKSPPRVIVEEPEEGVDEGGESGTPNYVTYDRVTAYLVAVVQKQQAEIDALKARIQ